MRFTIRDLMWAMVVVAMACALFSSYRHCQQLEFENDRLTDKDREAKGQLRFHSIQLRAFAAELEKISGKHVTGWGYVADASAPDGYRFDFRYADDRQPDSE
jgi:hypothetical protein